MKVVISGTDTNVCNAEYVSNGFQRIRVYQSEGKKGYIPCVFNPSETMVLWRINGTTYTLSHLPRQYEHDHLGLQLLANSESNGTRFQCLIQATGAGDSLGPLVTLVVNPRGI